MTDTTNTVPARISQGFSIAALIAGLGSLVLMVVFFFSLAGAPVLWVGVILGAAALVLGIIALKKGQPKGMAVTGLVVGAMGLVLGLAIFVFALIFVGAFMAESPYM